MTSDNMPPNISPKAKPGSKLTFSPMLSWPRFVLSKVSDNISNEYLFSYIFDTVRQTPLIFHTIT